MKVILFIIFPLVLTLPVEKEDADFENLPAEPKSRFAMLDDVRILANGLLQLGHGLKDFVHKTKGQINEIFQKLTTFDQSFDVLAKQTNEIKEKEEELKETTSKLQVNNEELKNISIQIHSQMENLLQDKSQLQNKVGRLEEKMTQIAEGNQEGSDLKDVAILKNFVEEQGINIRRLLKIVEDQHMQLDHQNGQIKDLEDKLFSAGNHENLKTSSTGHVIPRRTVHHPRNMTDPTADDNGTAIVS